MHRCLIFLGLLYSQYSIAQQRINTIEDKPKWFVGVDLLDYSYFSTTPSNNQLLLVRENYRSNTTAATSLWNIGVKLERYFYISRLSLATGLYYSNMTIVTKQKGSSFLNYHYYYLLMSEK